VVRQTAVFLFSGFLPRAAMLVCSAIFPKSACELFHDKAIFPAFQTRNPV
jgi:hypothetical protein